MGAGAALDPSDIHSCASAHNFEKNNFHNFTEILSVLFRPTYINVSKKYVKFAKKN